MRITLSGHVGTAITAQAVRRQLAAARGGPVEIDIASPGGYVDEAIEIYNILRGYAGPLTARLVGVVASAATLIACAAHRIVALSSSLWMIHSASLAMSGNARDLEHGAAILRKYDELLAAVYARKTGKDLATIRAWMANETWMTPTEALDAGFVDAIEGSAAQGHADLAAAKARVRELTARGYRPGELERAAALIAAPAQLDPETAAALESLGYSLADIVADPEALGWIALRVPKSTREMCAKLEIGLDDFRGTSKAAKFLRKQIAKGGLHV
jgi:ATP-dependent protease ClpP protease subunit